MTNKPIIKDSLLLCASDLQHSAIYDNHIEMQSCIRAVADRITALVSVIDGVGRAALAAPAQPVSEPSREGQYAELPEHDATTVGLGCVWNRHSMRAFADATHALRASHGQAPAPGEPSDSASAVREACGKIIKTLAAIVNSPQSDDQFDREVLQRDLVMAKVMEIKSQVDAIYKAVPLPAHPYMQRQKAAAAPAQANEYPPLGKGSLWRDAEGIRGYGTDPGPGPWYTTEDVHKAINADRAARSVYSRSMDLVRVFWQQHTQADALSMTMAELHTDVELVIRAALAAPAQVVPAPGVEAVSEREFKQFLSDVISAAGLVTHGKKCKDLGRRLGEMSMRIFTAPKTAAAPTQAGEYQPSSADMVMAALDTEEWGLERMQHWHCITEEGNRVGAWLVKRQKAPYCAVYTDKPGAPYGPRSWSGPTALDALQKAADDLGIRLPQPAARGAAQAAPVVAEDVLQNAERYRWLREKSSTLFVSVKINGNGAEIAETLDAAIDAARAQEQQP